ncbi:MAG: AmmeMemoRadiSam system protein B [Deltaproteobacteria bacterium]|nr:AmmeMemoRadiSam system protein B [Deltaproteobacteria bacterium]
MPLDLKVRTPAVAGSWYTDDPKRLAAEIDGYLAEGTPARRGVPLALVAPHAGYRYSGAIAGRAFAQVKDAPIRRVWVVAPSHRMPLSGLGLYPVDAFRTPLGDLPLDTAVVERLTQAPGFSLLTGGDHGEHALEIELPFLQRALGAFELVPILAGDLSVAEARRAADAIRAELGPGDLLVVSSDFTHYGDRFGYAPFGRPKDLAARLHALDHGAWAHLESPDPEALFAYLEETDATICGRNGLVLLAALVGSEAEGTEIAYDTSGTMTGDWGNTVSYLAGRVDGPAWAGLGPQTGIARLVSPETGRVLLDLARRSLASWFEQGKTLEVDPATLPPDASRTLGAFVTLTRDGNLRGCIGEITPERPAWKAVVDRALDAALRDPRFSPVTRAEWPELHVEISLLGPSCRVSGPRDVIVGRHGVVLSSGLRRATFLPQVAPEQGWDRDTMLTHLAHKAGLSSSAIAGATYDVYEAQVVHDAE